MARDLETFRSFPPIPERPDRSVQERIIRLKERARGERHSELRLEMQKTMTGSCSVFRGRMGLNRALDTIRGLKERYQDIVLDHHGLRFNTDLLEALELGSLLNLAEVILVSAEAREESRGAHFREDFPERHDPTWLKHTLAQRTGKGPRLFYRPVTLTRFEPKPRTY